MAGHSKFANIKHRKGLQDSKKSKICTKLRREIIVAANSGLPDPELNTRLKIAIYNARKEGLAKDRIDNAIKSATGANTGENYEEITYEAYGPEGVAIVIHGMTNNKNRTAADLRYILSKNNGILAETGSVRFLFEEVGIISYDNEGNFANNLDIALEVGAIDVEGDDEHISFYCNKNDFNTVSENLSKGFGQPKEARLYWKAINTLSLNTESQDKILELIDALEDNDDVQHIETNVKWQ